MDVVFIKEYLTYKVGAVLVNIDKLNGERLIGLGVAKINKVKKK
tara:strand:+ start:317 stop:448 length:132 start_codon:yes stop_codon:yes gene_type:complete